jgi:hypothetical protein
LDEQTVCSGRFLDNRARNSVETPIASWITLAGMDDDIPVVVRMRVECARCGHAADDTYEFDMPLAESEPMEEWPVSGQTAARRFRCI